jgi:hypothetical protein
MIQSYWKTMYHPAAPYCLLGAEQKCIIHCTVDGHLPACLTLPGGTVGYPAHPRLIRLSVCLSVCHLRFNYSAENRPGPTDLVKYSLKIVN